MSNDTRYAAGRMCNHIIRNIICSEIAIKNDLSFKYGYAAEMKRLGIPLFENGTKYYNFTVYLYECNVPRYLNGESVNFNLYACDNFYQDYFCSNYVREFLIKNKSNIIDANKFNIRIRNNNDVFVHVRLDDAEDSNPGFHYYDNMLKKIKFEQGYIASDTINHEICKKLIEKYDLIPVDMDPVETIMFGSTCKNIILSAGSFSWIIGVLGFDSTIYFPNFKGKNTFCPYELFDFPDWNSIDY